LLIKTLDDEDENVRSWSAYALGRARPVCEEAIQALMKHLSDPNDWARFKCADALVMIGHPAVPFLLEALKDGNELARELCTSVLCSIGPVSERVIPALINALADGCEIVRNGSANALGYIGSQALPALIKALQHENEWVRAKSAYSIGRMGLEAKSAVPFLVTARRDKSPRVRSKSARALNRINALEEEEQQNLTKRLRDSAQLKVNANATEQPLARAERSFLLRILMRVRDVFRLSLGVRPAELWFDELDVRITQWCAVNAANKITGLFVPDTDDLDECERIDQEILLVIVEAIKHYASHEARHGPICREELRRERTGQVQRAKDDHQIPF